MNEMHGEQIVTLPHIPDELKDGTVFLDQQQSTFKRVQAPSRKSQARVGESQISQSQIPQREVMHVIYGMNLHIPSCPGPNLVARAQTVMAYDESSLQPAACAKDDTSTHLLVCASIPHPVYLALQGEVQM
jgi:hypothetical protein